jgi:hypothetical protein
MTSNPFWKQRVAREMEREFRAQSESLILGDKRTDRQLEFASEASIQRLNSEFAGIVCLGLYWVACRN